MGCSILVGLTLFGPVLSFVMDFARMYYLIESISLGKDSEFVPGDLTWHGKQQQYIVLRVIIMLSKVPFVLTTIRFCLGELFSPDDDDTMWTQHYSTGTTFLLFIAAGLDLGCIKGDMTLIKFMTKK